MIPFLHGLNTMGFALASLYFLRFWRQTRDPFFLWFAAGFWLFAVNYIPSAFFGANDASPAAFVLRLVGFALIVVAILSKNVDRRQNSE